MEEKRIVTINGVEFNTTAEEQISASLLKALFEADAEDQVLVQSASGECYLLADEAALPLNVEQVFIVPAFAEGWEQELSETFRGKENNQNGKE